MTWTTPTDLRVQVQRLWDRGDLLRAAVTEGVSWPLAYGAFTLGMFFIGFAAYHTLRYFEQRKTKQLLAARRRGLAPQLIHRCNSGDTAGDRQRVVGYAAFAFHEAADHG